jgi:hypothetical protein
VRVFVVPLLAAGFALGLAMAATELTNGPAPQRASPTSIVWSGRVFTSRSELAAWLKGKGASYETWAALHPTMSSILVTKNQNAVGFPSNPAGRAAGDASRTLAIVALAASVLGILALLVASPAKSQRIRQRRIGAGRRGGSRLATRSRRPLTRSMPRMTLGAGLRRGLPTGLPPFLAGRRERDAVDDEAAPYHSIVPREALRQLAPDIALYVASGLFACVIGISIALYMN